MTKPADYREKTRPFGKHTSGNHPAPHKMLRYDTPPQHEMHEGPGLSGHMNHGHGQRHQPIPKPCGKPGLGGTNYGHKGSQRCD